MLIGLVLAAWAQQAEPQAPLPPTSAEPAAKPADEEKIEEVDIYAQARIQMARQELIEKAAELGYTKVIDRQGRTILRHELPWHGEIVLVDDGQVEVKRQPVRFEPPFAKDKPAAWLSCILIPICIRPGGQLVSGRRYHQFEREAWAGIEDNVVAWNDRIADAATSAKVDELPARLEALWEHGIALDGSARLNTWEEKRRALFSFWDSRTETEWGRSVRQAVEAFMRGVVQNGDHPYTPEELEVLNRTRSSSQPLSL